MGSKLFWDGINDNDISTLMLDCVYNSNLGIIFKNFEGITLWQPGFQCCCVEIQSLYYSWSFVHSTFLNKCTHISISGNYSGFGVRFFTLLGLYFHLMLMHSGVDPLNLAIWWLLVLGNILILIVLFLFSLSGSPLMLCVGLVLLITFCTIFHLCLFALYRKCWRNFIFQLLHWVSKFLFSVRKISFAVCSWFYSILFLFH